MTEETTTEQLAEIEGQGEQEPQPEPVQVREGRWRTRGGDIRNVTPTPEGDGRKYTFPWWDAQYRQTWTSDGRYYLNTADQRDLIEYLGPIEPEPQPEPQQADTPATEYTPPDGWRLLRFGELLLPGDHWVNWEGTVSRPDIQHGDGATASDGRYIRWVKPQPQPVPMPVPVPVPVPEPVLKPEPQPELDAELRIRLLQQANDSQAETIGRLLTEARDLNMEIGGLERRLSERDARIRDLETMHATAAQAVVDAGKVNDKLRAQIEELRSEVSYVQNLLGTEKRRVTELEELVASLRTINRGCENAVRDAGKENTALRNQLAAVKAELATQAETSRRLQIELDAAQQVPADSPELRQLRADLAEVTRDRDTYRHAHELLVQDVNATHQRTKVMTVEAIVEWLVPIRTCGSQALAAAVVSNLPHIMRSLTGLVDEEPDPQLAPY